MRHTSKSLIAAVAAVLFAACSATAAEHAATSARAEVTKAKTVKKTVRAPVKHEYENVAGFKGHLRDPLHAYAAEPQAVYPSPPIITHWPMANTVWW